MFSVKILKNDYKFGMLIVYVYDCLYFIWEVGFFCLFILVIVQIIIL